MQCHMTNRGLGENQNECDDLTRILTATLLYLSGNIFMHFDGEVTATRITAD